MGGWCQLLLLLGISVFSELFVALITLNQLSVYLREGKCDFKSFRKFDGKLCAFKIALFLIFMHSCLGLKHCGVHNEALGA